MDNTRVMNVNLNSKVEVLALAVGSAVQQSQDEGVITAEFATDFLNRVKNNIAALRNGSPVYGIEREEKVLPPAPIEDPAVTRAFFGDDVGSGA